MAKFASKVPFSLGEIQRGSGSLAVVSDDAEHLAKLLKITGNTATVLGGDFALASLQIQRSFSAGISSAELFRERGVKAISLNTKQNCAIEVIPEAKELGFVGIPDRIDVDTNFIPNDVNQTIGVSIDGIDDSSCSSEYNGFFISRIDKHEEYKSFSKIHNFKIFELLPIKMNSVQ